MTDTAPHQAHHEASDANIRGVIGFAVGLAVVAIVVQAMVWVLFTYFDAREATAGARRHPLSAAQESRLPPEPRLQTNPRQDLQDLRIEEDKILNTYGWVDKSAGVVRIPLGEAMRLTVERGLPSRRAGSQ